MSQRHSGYARREDEQYETPGWVAEVLVPHLPRKPRVVVEPAPGTGRMLQALAGAFGPSVRVRPGEGCFTSCVRVTLCDTIITNPPYGFGGRQALEFIETALDVTSPDGMVAMLLKVDFDSGKSRAHVFADHKAWAKKLVLRRRILWFPSETGCGPSENHAWYIWDHKHQGPPTIAYAP